MADESKQKIIIIGVSSLILVVMVVAITIGTNNNNTDSYNRQDISSSQKAVQIICAPTDYKDACYRSLQSTAKSTTDPKELIEAAFRGTIDYLKDAAENSTVLRELEKDPRTKLALDDCKELANRAINDLEKTYSKFEDFDFSNLDKMFADLQTWLSGAVTYQETCLDGFEDSQGDAGVKMSNALKTSMELTSNALAMITDISSVLSSMDITQFEGTTSRRLLSEDHLPILAHAGTFPDWLDFGKRKLLETPLSSIVPDLIVAKDGTGKFTTINEALNVIPRKSERIYILYIKEGVYEEKVQIDSNVTYLMIVGDGPTKTRITGSLNFIDGTSTYRTATVAVVGDHFIAKDIGFENSAGAEKHQAVALRVGGDKTVFYNCHMDGYQDTLYTHTYRQFYRNCSISGTIDFVFGDAAALFQDCTFVVRKPLQNQQCIVTAQGRKDIRQPTGIVLQNCSIVADPFYYPVRNTLKSYLGRPWKQYSRTIIMESFIDDLIQPQGWLPWNETFALETLFYTEFNNRGPGSSKTNRIKWPGVKELPPKRIERFTADKFIEVDTWLPATGVPYNPGFVLPLPKEDHNVKYSPPSSQENKDLGKKKDRDSYSPRQQSSSDKEDDPSPSPGPYSSSNVHIVAPAPMSSLWQATPIYAPGPAPMSSLRHAAPVNAPGPAPVSSLRHEAPVNAPGLAPMSSLRHAAPVYAPGPAPDSSSRYDAPVSGSAPMPTLQYSHSSSLASSPSPSPSPSLAKPGLSKPYFGIFPGFL